MISIDGHVRVVSRKAGSVVEAHATHAGQPWHAQPHVAVTLAPRRGRTWEEVHAACWYLVAAPLEAEVEDDFFAPERRRAAEEQVRDVVREAVRQRTSAA